MLPAIIDKKYQNLHFFRNLCGFFFENQLIQDRNTEIKSISGDLQYLNLSGDLPLRQISKPYSLRRRPLRQTQKSGFPLDPETVTPASPK